MWCDVDIVTLPLGGRNKRLAMRMPIRFVNERHGLGSPSHQEFADGVKAVPVTLREDVGQFACGYQHV